MSTVNKINSQLSTAHHYLSDLLRLLQRLWERFWKHPFEFRADLKVSDGPGSVEREEGGVGEWCEGVAAVSAARADASRMRVAHARTKCARKKHMNARERGGETKERLLHSQKC